MRLEDATRETILANDQMVELISANGQSCLLGRSTLSIDGEDITVWGTMSNDAEAVEACILFEGGEGDLTRDKLYPQLCRSFGVEESDGYKYWMICGEFNERTTIGELISVYNEYPSGYWNTGEWTLATPAEIAMAEARREEERKRIEAELKEMGFAYKKTYETNSWYQGRHDYHHSHGSSFRFNKPLEESKYPFKVGVELEVIANDRKCYDKITELKSNWFFMERDGSLDEYGIEIVTVPLRFEDASDPCFWKEMTAWLSKYAKSWTKSCCGLHVHIGNEVFNMDGCDMDELKAKLSYAYNYNIDNDEINATIFGRSRGYSASKCKTKVGDAVETLSTLVDGEKDLLKDKKIKDALVKETKECMGRDRYFEVNMSNAKTVEFRKGRGSINCERIAGIIMYCYLMAMWSNTTDWNNILSMASFKDYIRANAPAGHPIFKWLSEDERDC